MARKAVPHSSLIPLICLLLSIPAVADYKINYIHTDHRGAPVAITDQSQTVIWRASYKPFGEAILQEDPDGDGVNTVMNIRYPGQYYDKEAGAYYNYYRDYDPGLGRYIQSDPIGLRGGLNTYAYVNQNPINYIDPYGLRQRNGRGGDPTGANRLSSYDSLLRVASAAGWTANVLGAASLCPGPHVPFTSLGSMGFQGLAAGVNYSNNHGGDALRNVSAAAATEIAGNLPLPPPASRLANLLVSVPFIVGDVVDEVVD